ncbi:InlB B-repeat-containing protein [Pumilibacter muris]|uniref:InlB B-repeat-containing protein n=1 Tax=Pumilibacter muris TaxID=2941510 RepID=UPI00203A8C6C|nr:InlB B-repeat-containing protein [Pumilibacter muris]
MKHFTMGKQMKRRGVIVAFCAMAVLALVAALSFMSKTEARAANGIHGTFSQVGENSVSFALTENVIVSSDNKIALYGCNWRAAQLGEIRGAGRLLQQINVQADSTTLKAGTFWVFNIPESFSYSTASFILEFTGTYWGTSYSEILVIQKPVPLPADPVKEGHHFVGWYYDEELTRPYNGEPIYADTTLYPKFEINTYTVTYNSTGGSSVNSVTVNWDSAAPTPTPTRTGYKFVGWFMSDGTKYDGAGIKENITLMAHWDIQMYTVTFMNANHEVYTTLSVPYGTTLVSAMEEAQIASYGVKDVSGYLISKTSSITEDTQVLVYELTGMEKVGDYIGTHEWVLWTVVGFVAALMITAGVAIAVAVKRGQ